MGLGHGVRPRTSWRYASATAARAQVLTMKNILFLMVVAYALSACAQREQVVEQQSSEKRYQGKRDSKPWDNDPLAYGSGKWSKRDRTRWETQIKTRQQGQNEDKRIYQ